jgi:hypothetical protein
MTLYDQAEQRVTNSDQLMPYYAVIMYDWPEGDEHWQWVIDSPDDVILDWVQSVGHDDWFKREVVGMNPDEQF